MTKQLVPVKDSIDCLRACLNNILDNPCHSRNSNITQSMIVDQEGADVLSKLSNSISGNVVLVQAAQINNQVVRNSAKALKYLNDIEMRHNSEQSRLTGDEDMLEKALEQLLFRRLLELKEIDELVHRKCFEIVERRGRSNAEKARRLGLKRTTYLSQKSIIERKNQEQEVIDV